MLDFAALRRAAQKAHLRPAAKKPEPAENKLPGWLDELDSLFREPALAVGPTPDWLQPSEPAAPGLPDWFDESSPSEDAEPEPEEPEPEAPASPPLAAPVAAAPAEVPIAAPVAAPVGGSLLQRMGIDPTTERVVDWAKLKAWISEQLAQRPGGELPVPTEFDADPFQTARKQLAAWFALKKNQERITQGEDAAIRQDPALQQFMNHFVRFGAEKQAHLWEFVDFLIETRRRG